ncbi:membrane fusion protein, multidrug efflux system [Monaibacterium marinum]|uniref:Membrane fusion protein, multidrug efflux system n=2 Tax=Pontivivens marinum TaxID=1690039 RepID=A0A2C9CWN0_9RHOB|nr:membrane fusion protein, multidrug efflux system [Monaibacterium marinum]
MTSRIRLFTSVFCVVATMYTPSNAQPMGSGPVEVGVIEATLQAVPQVATLPGRAVAFQEVEVRPRVSGVIEEILYTPGQQLEVGDPLFQIDKSAYLAQEASALADVAIAQANLQVAQSAADRAEQLAGRGYTEAEVETARASLLEAQATLDANEAAVEYAQVELSWTTITSPIIGRADVSDVSVGDLVTSGQSDELTTIVRADPIYVDMVEASSRILSVRRGIDDGSLQQADNMQATLFLENGDVFRGVGQMVTPGNSVSTTTGSVTVRFQFENEHHVVIPGSFVRGEITVGSVQAFLVPQRAATRGNSGDLTVFIVGEDGTAEQVTLSDDGSYQNSWIVREGLSEGDRIIVDGLSSLQAGQDVLPVAAMIDEDGLVRDLADTDAAAAPSTDGEETE